MTGEIGAMETAGEIGTRETEKRTGEGRAGTAG